jgi:predicted phosphoribosyltransferase
MFRDRTEAGQLLAQRLASRAYPRPVVLALPRVQALLRLVLSRQSS